MKEKNGRNLKKNPFNDKTEDGVKFRLQDQKIYMIIAENYKIIAENYKIIEEPCTSS